MEKQKVLITSMGVEGGGFDVYLLPDGSVIEEGSSGGILDEEEDPHIHWEKLYASPDSWWSEYIQNHPNFWYHLHVLYIHPDYVDRIRDIALNALHNLQERVKSELYDFPYLMKKWDLDKEEFK